MNPHRFLVVAVLSSLAVVGCGGGGNSKPKDAGPDTGPQPQCNDGIDNDGDGKIDFPNDPGCVVAQQDDETDDCPDGSSCPQCGNGKDDDANGKIDYPDDPGCTSAGDDDEYTTNPVACGTNIMIKPLPPIGMAMGTFDATTPAFSQVSPCGGGDTNGIAVFAYELYLTEPKVIVASTIGSSVDTVLDIRSADCQAATSELACNDNDTGQFSKVTYSAQAGLYYILVENKAPSATGDFKLTVEQLAGEGHECTDTSQCGPGLLCRIPAGGSTMSCEKPVCNDGRDDDGDGKMDFPNDPGCGSTDDADETDDCPSGPNCPACGNGMDDDNDGQTDYPADPACTSASATSESCLTAEGVTALTMPSTMGTTVGATDDSHLTCGSSSNTAGDLAYQLTVPALTSLTIANVNMFDEAVALFDATCGGTALACSDEPETLTFGAMAAGTYYYIVDGWSSSSGAFTINVSGTIASGESCESPLAVSGALICDTGYACKGTMGSRTCQPATCNDGMDNDGDTKMDYPTDPGCASPSDDDETDDCPSGPSCPVCANGMDDDGDGQTDYPNDTSCAAAGYGTEASCSNDMENGGLITQPTTLGDLTTGNSDLSFTCSLTPSGNDMSFILELPVPVTALTVDTSGSSISDTQVELWSGTCTTALGCDDDSNGLLSSLTVTNLAAGHYAVSVAAYSTSSNGAFHLNTHGTLASGTPCDSALFTAGVLACDTGLACTGTPLTCQ